MCFILSFFYGKNGVEKRYLSGSNGGTILVEGNIKKVYEKLARTLVEWYQIDYDNCLSILEKTVKVI